MEVTATSARVGFLTLAQTAMNTSKTKTPSNLGHKPDCDCSDCIQACIQARHDKAIEELHSFIKKGDHDTNIKIPANSLLKILRRKLENADGVNGDFYFGTLNEVSAKVLQKVLKIPSVEDKCAQALLNSPEDWLENTVHIPILGQSRLLLLEVLLYLANYKKNNGADVRLSKVAACYKAADFVWWVWEGYFQLARDACAQVSTKNCDINNIEKDFFPALLIGANGEWEHVFDVKNGWRKRWDAIRNIKENIGLEVEARFITHEHQILTLFNYAKYPNRPNFFGRWVNNKKIKIFTKNIGLKKTALPSLENQSENVKRCGAPVPYRLGGLLVAMGMDFWLQEKKHLVDLEKIMLPPLHKNAGITQHGYFSIPAISDAVKNWTGKQDLLGNARRFSTTINTEVSLSLDLNCEFIHETDEDGKVNGEWLINIADSNGNFSKWQNGAALDHLNGYSIRTVVMARDRKSNEFIDNKITGLSHDWEIDDHGVARFYASPRVPEQHILKDKDWKKLTMESCRLIDMREELGEPVYLLQIILTGW